MVLPLVDLITAVVRRTSRGLSPFAPDRGHLHHRLLDIGHSHRRTVLIMYAWTFLFAFGIVILSTIGVPILLFPVVIALAVGVLVLMAAPRWRGRGGLHSRGRSDDDDGPPTGPMPPVLPEAEVRGRVAPPDLGPGEHRASAEGKPVIPAFPGRS
jgi:UDP-GlcNAc:undecaprenyl-phosphate GlcNAc-1-phosphate transferase